MPFDADPASRRNTYRFFRNAVLAGLAVIVPVVITLAVLGYVFRLIATALDGLSDAVIVLPGTMPSEVIIELGSVGILIALVVVVGVLTRHRYGQQAVAGFDAAMGAIPAIGTVYRSFRRMSEVLVEGDGDNFREVKLVEYPHEGSYSIAFVTSETAPTIEEAVGISSMQTLFLPMTPNPVMGGFLIHVEADRVHDVDMTVEEGIRAIVTSGVAVHDPNDETGESFSADGDPALDPFDVGAPAPEAIEATIDEEEGRH